MSGQLNVIKHKLAEAITQLCEVSWMFVKKPGQDFTRKRKLSFEKMVSFLLAMEGGSLTTELLKYFGCSVDVAPAQPLFSKEEKLILLHFLLCSICSYKKQIKKNTTNVYV